MLGINPENVNDLPHPILSMTTVVSTFTPPSFRGPPTVAGTVSFSSLSFCSLDVGDDRPQIDE